MGRNKRNRIIGEKSLPRARIDFGNSESVERMRTAAELKNAHRRIDQAQRLAEKMKTEKLFVLVQTPQLMEEFLRQRNPKSVQERQAMIGAISTVYRERKAQATRPQ